MAKNIVICSDGTGNSGPKRRGTNVFKLFEAVDLHGQEVDPDLTDQVAIYDDGVGTDRMRLMRALGGAFGWGMKRNIKRLYLELARVYEPGDQIYLFGFSRGAFTVRSLAGLITARGIPKSGRLGDADLSARVDSAYRRHRLPYRTWLMTRWDRLLRRKDASFALSADHFHTDEPPEGKPRAGVGIRFVGVWDTVDAVGFPVDWLAEGFNQLVYQYKFRGYELSPLVRRGCHALAIDDERRTFHPRLWNEKESESEERIEQVWFSGVHSNVGGGYPKQGMSLVSLVWMMERAQAEGLRFTDLAWQQYLAQRNVSDKLYDPRAGMAVFYRFKPRNLQAMCEAAGVEPRLHASVFERLALGVDGYAPGNLPTAPELAAGGPSLSARARRLERRLASHDAHLLPRVRGSVRFRRWAHIGVAGVLAVWAVLSPEVSPFLAAEVEPSAQATATPGLTGSAVEWLVWLVRTESLIALGAALVLGLAYGIGRVCRRRMHRAFSEEWAQIRG